MAGQEITSKESQNSDPIASLKARITDTNIDGNTFLATDYLNHFNEIVMLLEMIPDMPDILEEAKEWQPKSYAEHFNDSGLSDSALTIEAYENAPVEFREPFEETVERMNKVVFKNIENIEAALESTRPEELAATAATASRLLQRLIDVAAAIIHGNTPNLDQSEIDELLAG
ncbi:MAG: hypothetical protein HOK30_25190 [Rhodospirillaceae bacterium]|nr:hypothetical protein [Rhodospirillaceae bacterium]MBT5191237.1 hypothetical protein [Rhodospirillaceae bacterium]MBT5897211.1 hypothetical protein [Rhodospirillaceae bacterium]MBT6430987.1 hypothetical protein [Rhodospirillaceae bacterium]MBT7758615.1 hypothetical protein [Rhodospirillaceae bacterium]